MTDQPQLYRSNLVPEGAVGVPAPVRDADDRLRAAAPASDKASADRLEADKADRGAAQFDSQAALAAAEAGKPTPQPTAAAKAAGFARAGQHEAATRAIARREMLALGRTVVEHRDEWREAQQPSVIDQADAALARLGILAALRKEVDPDHGLSFKSPVVGSGQGRRVTKILDELREGIRAVLPAPPPTEHQLREAEQFQATTRGLRKMASGTGGIHVP